MGIFRDSGETRLAGEDRRPSASTFDLGGVRGDQLIEIQTHNSRYRIMMRFDAVIGSNSITGVAINSNDGRSNLNGRRVMIDRQVTLGSRFYFGNDGRSNTSPVRAVYVGGRKVL